MSAKKLKQLLTKGDVVGDTLVDTIAHCDAWYAIDAGLTTFALRSIFRDLQLRGWDNQQGIATVVYNPFKNGVLPHLLRIADILSATPAAEPMNELTALIVAYRDSLLATP
jgi:hypothetical protein